MNWFKKCYKILTEKPKTKEEIDEMIKKAVSDYWRKRIMEGR